MESGWTEVSTGEEVTTALDLPDIDGPVLERLLLAPESAQYLRVELDETTRPPQDVFAYFVPGTRYFFNVSACREFWGDAMVALVAFLATHSAPIAAGAAAVRKVYDNLALLSSEEARVVRAIIRACPGNPYEVPVAEADVRQVLRGDPDRVDDLLDALQTKGIITGRRRDRIQLTF